MIVARVLSQSRFALHRSFTAQRATVPTIRIVSTAVCKQRFSSSARSQEEIVQTPATGSEVPLTSTKRPASEGQCKQSIAITKMPWSTVPADVEQLLRNVGVDIKKMQFRIDRFTFTCDTAAFIELGSEEQARKAIKALDGVQLEQRKLKVSPLSSTFYWDAGFKQHSRMFFYDANTPSQAIQGLLDRRRYALYVENPGWHHDKELGKSAKAQRKELIVKHLGPYDVETIGPINPVWKVDKRFESTFLAYIEFASKEGAQRAAKDLNGKVIEGKRVQLKPAEVPPRRARQMEKVDKGLLAQLQQHGFLIEESSDKVEA